MKLLVLLTRVPFPLDKGDKLRAYYQLLELQKEFDLKVICLTDQSVEQQHLEHLKSLFNIEIVPLNKGIIYWNLLRALFSPKPFQVHYFFQQQAQRKINRIIEAFQPDHIFGQLIRCTEYIKNIHHIPKTLDYMDTFSKGMERRIEGATFPKKQLFRIESKRLLKYEHLVFDYFENKTIISEQDRSHIYHEKRNQIVIIRNGVDFHFFTPRSDKKSCEVLFTGNMNYPPNIDGACYLVKEIMPIVWKKIPHAQVKLAGSSPAKEVLELASNNVEVTGWINDIRDAYASGKVFIAPMRIGTGLQNKLLEAMSMKIPSITTPLANNALKANPAAHIKIGKNTQELAQHIIELLSSPQTAAIIGENGRQYVTTNFSWETSTNKLSTLIRSASVN